MIRTQISMTADQAEALRRLATARRRSQAALLRDALDSLIGTDELGRRVARARSAVGRFGSGATDTAEQHDKALTTAIVG